jgi:hypothetical protein
MGPISAFNLRSFFVRSPRGVLAGEIFYIEKKILQSALSPLWRVVAAGIQ